MRPNRLLIAFVPVGLVISVFCFVGFAARQRDRSLQSQFESVIDSSDTSIVRTLDQLLADRWQDSGLEPAASADELTCLRRLALTLHGTIPSLEEIRLFESDHSADRIESWIQRMLADRRFADYFARRLARVFVGVDQGNFVIFRRDRLWAWLADQLHSNRAYDAIVRDLISERGLWTDKPAVNFVAAAVNEGTIDRNKLAGRTVRAFLGQRIDCAQCHDHPFADWKLAQFEGLAACFGQVSISIVGVEDNQKMPYRTQDRRTLNERVVELAVPFHNEWMPSEGSNRERLAVWVTHAGNRRFDRAIVNRIWGLMFGKSWVQPVDDLPDPREPDLDSTDLLDLLAADFQTHGRDLKRLISVICRTQAFRSSSQHPAFENQQGAQIVDVEWLAFPITRLRPEQVIGSMLQSASIKTLDQNSHWTQRAIRFFRELDYVKDYGDLGEDELTERSGTIPQALLRMNSKFAEEWTKGTIFSSAGRIAGMAPDDDACLELCFLTCLTRRPTDDERSTIRKQLDGTTGEIRTRVVEDVFWSLFNSPEFCWVH